MIWYNPTTWTNKKRRPSETGAQTTTSVQYTGELTKPREYGTSSWHAKLERMRRQPTIAFARILAAAPILAADWSIDKDDGKDVDFIDEHIIKPFKFHLSKHAAFGMIDWGWQPFDIEYRLEGGSLIPSWYKPLLQQFTTIVVHENGKFHYLRNQVPGTTATEAVNIHPSNSMIMSSGVEGTNWYGHALMANVEGPFDEWEANQISMQRYGRKLAGAGLIIKHPIGMTNGEDNNALSNRLIRDFVLVNGVALPKSDDEQENWELSILESSYGVTPYIESARYYDAEFFRGLHLSERSGLEGQFGTKAESETQKDFSIEAQVSRHIEMLEGLNNHLQYITQLHFDDATARIVPAPIQQEKLNYLRSVYDKLFADPANNELDSVDMNELREMIGIPVLDEEVRQANFDNFDLANQTDGEGLPVQINTDETTDETQEGEQPLVSTNVLNGAQISSAVALLQSMGAGTLTQVAAKELLTALGIPAESVARMVDTLPENTLTAEQTIAASNGHKKKKRKKLDRRF